MTSSSSRYTYFVEALWLYVGKTTTTCVVTCHEYSSLKHCDMRLQLWNFVRSIVNSTPNLGRSNSHFEATIFHHLLDQVLYFKFLQVMKMIWILKKTAFYLEQRPHGFGQSNSPLLPETLWLPKLYCSTCHAPTKSP